MAKLIWITGLAGSGKTTIGERVFSELKKKNQHTVFIDGDHFREVVGGTTGHSREERFAVGMQIARLCKLLVGQGIDVVCSTISLFEEIHEFNRANFADYTEVFVHCDMDELMRRDKKGIYSRAIKGELSNVVGVDIAFDTPKNCHLTVDNSNIERLDGNIIQILDLINL